MIWYNYMIAILITILVTFLVSSMFAYWIHRLLHQSWAGYLYKKHLTHHLILYPPTNYVSDKYRSAGKDNSVFIFAVIALPFAIIPIVLWLTGYLPLVLMITVLVIEGIVGFLNNYMHDSFHIKNHWMYHIPLFGFLFRYLVYLHYIHHCDMSKNYSIFWFLPDKLFGTFNTDDDDLPFVP